MILDGGKGLRVAVRKAFRRRAVVQRCQWHKRENVVSYLAKTEQPLWRQRLQRAYHRPEYDEAVAALRQLHGELEDRNQSAARSLTEGFDETLTLHRLGAVRRAGAVAGKRRTVSSPSMRLSKNAVRRSIAGRTRANATVGWRPRLSISSHACGK